MTYLNHAGTSWPKPPSVRAAAQAVEDADPSTWGEHFATAHARIAAHFAVPTESLLPTPSCTQALAVAVADIPWQPGDRVLTTSMEHHALWRPLTKLAARGVEVVELPRAPDGLLDLEALRAALASGPTRLVAMSMASNVTGEALPWVDVVSLAHDHGALCLLDGAQVAGWVPLDLTALEVDLFAFAGHKGPQAPSGIGGLYVRPGLFLDTPGASCDGAVCRTGPGYCDTGSVNLPALVGLAAGLDWMRAHEPLAQAQAHAAQLRAQRSRWPGAQVVGGPALLPTISLVHPDRNPQELASSLHGAGIMARAGTQCAPRAHRALGTGSKGTLRLSIGPTTTSSEVDAAIVALETAMRRVIR